MKRRNRIIMSVTALSAMLLMVSAPVYARNGADDTTTSSSISGSDSGSTTPKTAEVEKKKTELEVEHQKTAEDSIRARGAAMVAELKKEKKETKTADELKQKCESRKNGLQTKVDNLVTNAQKHQDKITGVYGKVVAYQNDANLTVTNWRTLIGAAVAAKVQSQNSVSALTALKPTVDCTKGTVAADVANFKAAAAQARADLKAYRTAVKALLAAVETTKEGQQ